MDTTPEPDSDASKRHRPPEIGEIEGEIGGQVMKKAFKRRRKENGEVEMRRVAEIVLVLSAMGRMRGGRDPTAVEKAMMAEARKKVVALCEELAPKDILPREAFRVVIEDLGLDKLKEQRLGFGPPKMSISDKLAYAKRRMEESKAFAAQPASYPSQRLHNTGAVGENRGTPPNIRAFPSDKAGHVPVSSGNFPPPAPVVHVSTAASTPLQFRPPGTEVRPAVVPSPVPNNIVRDSPSMVPPRVDRAHIKPDGRPNGPSFVPHVPVSSSADQHVGRTAHMPMQPQPAPWANAGTKNKVPDHHLPVRVDGNATSIAPQKTASPAVVQTPKPVVSQTAPVPLPGMHHPVQGMQFAQPSPVPPNHHLEISKMVQKLLNPKLPERPVWTPPSREYMTRAVTCQFCKVIINGVENVLVCDACEKGFHLGCLQSYNAKSLPKGEWHCPRCLTMNRGKPFPPKYGRVTRNMNAPKGSSNTAGGQLSSEKKVETVDKKVNKPNTTTNGNSDFKAHPQAGNLAESLSGSNRQHGNEVSKIDMPTSIKKDETSSEKHPKEPAGPAVDASVSTSIGASSEKPSQQEVKSEISPSEDRLTFGAQSTTPTIPHVSTMSDQKPMASNQNDVGQHRLSNGGEVPVLQHGNCNGVVECNTHFEDGTCEKDALQKNPNAAERACDQAREPAEPSVNGMPKIDWIGDTDRIVDAKKYFQSCCISGVVYKVHDYALFRSDNGKLMPVKLQAMWEDSQTSSKWLVVHKCYFPDDLPEEVGRPGAPQSNEVYESTHDSNVMAGFIEGPCEVLPFRKFGEEMERANQGSQANDRKQPVFIRNWFYDESRRAFCPNAC